MLSNMMFLDQCISYELYIQCDLFDYKIWVSVFCD